MHDLNSFFHFESQSFLSVESLTCRNKNFKNSLTLKADDHFKICRPIWEFRLFWPEHRAPISLPPSLLSSLSSDQFQNLVLSDTYILVDNKFLNLKIRHNKLAYKPLIEQEQGMLAYGKKIKFSFPLDWQKLYLLFPRLEISENLCLNLTSFREFLHHNGYQTQLITFDKMVRRCQLNACLQLELSQFDLNHQRWFSLCVEGDNYHLIQQQIVTLENTQGNIMGYVEFLKKYGQL